MLLHPKRWRLSLHLGLLLALSLGFSSCALAQTSCRSIPKEELATWGQKLGPKWEVPLQNFFNTIHLSLHTPYSIPAQKQQLQQFSRSLDVATWSRVLKMNPDSQEFQLYLSWLRDRYIGYLLRVPRGREIQLNRIQPRWWSADLRQQVEQFPAAPTLSRIQSFSCRTQADHTTYPCQENLLRLRYQLSASVFCRPDERADRALIHVLVRQDGSKLRILDIEREYEPLFQRATLDWIAMSRNLSTEGQRRLLATLTSTPPPASQRQPASH